MKNEPLVTRATIVAGVGAVLALLAAFGLDLSDAQQNAILGVALVAAPLMVAFLARPHVTPYAKPTDERGDIDVSLALLVIIVIETTLILFRVRF